MLRCTKIFFTSVPSMTDLVAAFQVLGLQYRPSEASSNPSITTEQVRSKYLQLARLHHPDLSSGDDAKMKVINTAYELIQSSGVLNKKENLNDQTTDVKADGLAARFTRKAGSLRRKVPDEFANGYVDKTFSWSMKSTLEWHTMTNTFNTVTKEELSNPANHIFSHSKFFSFDDDVRIYKMLRSGATVPQVGRTLGKPATFIERRIHNAQFKARIQYILRNEKKNQKLSQDNIMNSSSTSTNSNKKNPFKSGSKDDIASVKEWEPTVPRASSRRYFSNMSLEEKGRFSKILPETDNRNVVFDPRRTNQAASHYGYKNYARLSSTPTN